MGVRLGVIGAGYLGATQAACLAELGHDVVAADVDAAKVKALDAGVLPFFEPRLADLLYRHTSSGRLRFTTDLTELADHADVHFVCVGTPQRPDGAAADTSHVFSAVADLVPRLTRATLVVGKSTVPVGTAAHWASSVTDWRRPGSRWRWRGAPEFTREGTRSTTLTPDRLVFGLTSTAAERTLRGIYRDLLDADVPVVVTDPATSELVKLAANAFLATKLSFANALAELCEAAGGDVLALTKALGYDLRIGHRYLAPGLGFGGGCLPKDLRALTASAADVGAEEAFAFLDHVDRINTRRRQRTVALALEECRGSVLARRVAVLGAAFKPDTDDVRDSPALDVAARLHLQGADVAVYDPRANVTAARVFRPHLRRRRGRRRGAHLVLHLTEWTEFASLDPHRLHALVAEPRILDARNTLDAERWRRAGWSFRSLGARNNGHRVGPDVLAPGRPDAAWYPNQRLRWSGPFVAGAGFEPA